jgi:hypothetical protein
MIAPFQIDRGMVTRYPAGARSTLGEAASGGIAGGDSGAAGS